MPANRARSSTSKKVPIKEAKARVLESIRDGLTIAEAMAAVDRSKLTYDDWVKGDEEFRAAVAQTREVARAARARGDGNERVEVPDYPEFCEKYLGMPVPEHHLRIWDVLNGREPRSMHPAIRYQVGRPNRVLLNLPPFHSKTQNWSVQYALWRMMKDPGVRIAIVSKTQGLAKKIVFQILQYLERPQYAALQRDFMPEGGWKSSSMPWTQTEIYLANAGRDGGDVNKDPTLQALGYGSQIYGSRLDVIILDDLIDLKNAHQSEAIVDWIGREAASRIDTNGTLHVLGTRLAPNDIYQRLRDLIDWDGETPVWTQFAQPAVLERPQADPTTWVTLWPKLADGRPMWDGLALAKAKAELHNEAAWQLTYQQTDAALDQTFPSAAVMASVDNSRSAGPYVDGLYTVVGCDPAADGFTAMVVMGVDKATGKRFILDGWNQARMPPELLIHKLKEFVGKYRASQLIIETNAFQGFLARNADLRDYCYARGCLMVEHRTAGHAAVKSQGAAQSHTTGKWDEDLGVSSMSTLWLSCADHDPESDTWTTRPRDKHLISLPNPKFATFCDALIEQLIAWVPKAAKKGVKTDVVMATWFCHVAVQKILDLQQQLPSHMSNPFQPRGDAARRSVVNLNDLREAKLRGEGQVFDLYGRSLA